MIIKELEEMKKYAIEFAKKLKGNELITLEGDLGAGKTTFTKFLLAELGVKKIVNSPTFAIIKNYETNVGLCHHIDAYRLSDGEDIYDEITSDNLRIIEWAANIEEDLNDVDYALKILKLDDDRREIICN